MVVHLREGSVPHVKDRKCDQDAWIISSSEVVVFFTGTLRDCLIFDYGCHMLPHLRLGNFDQLRRVFGSSLTLGNILFATLGPHMTYTHKVWQDSLRLANLWLGLFGSRPSIATLCHTFLPTLPKLSSSK